MKFSLVNGERREAKSGISGTCPNCEKPMIAKCGEKKIHHWSHKGRLECDPWWENETQWHRNWKAHFPTEWQEIIQYAENGEKHIADVKTNQDWVIEFQHSYLKPEERKARNKFYKKLVWVVDGKRLQGDEKRLLKALNSGTPIGPSRRISPDECSLVNDWNGSQAPVFFDFGISTNHPEKSVLWVLLPKSSDGMAYVFPYLRAEFIEIYLQGTSQKAIEFERFLNDWPTLVHKLNNPLKTQSMYSYPRRRGGRL